MLARIDERIKVMDKKVDDIHKIIHGNGKKGLCDSVTINTTRLATLEKKHERDSKFRLTMMGLGFTALGIVIAVTNFMW